MNASLSRPQVNASLCCGLAAWSSLRASAADIAAWRRQPISIGARSLPANSFKYAEDQTVLAMRGMLAALEKNGWQDRSFSDWGVIAAGVFFGRQANAQNIVRYRTEGAWGMSPHLIPQQSVHAMSGAISQALEIHGPNFGVGGGPDAAAETLLLAAALLHDGSLPGLWIVLTGHESEWIPLPDDRPNPAPTCQALILGLTSLTHDSTRPVLIVGQSDADDTLAHLPEFQAGQVAEELAAAAPAGRWRLGEAHWVEIEAVNGLVS